MTGSLCHLYNSLTHINSDAKKQNKIGGCECDVVKKFFSHSKSSLFWTFVPVTDEGKARIWGDKKSKRFLINKNVSMKK